VKRYIAEIIVIYRKHSYRI